MRRRELGFAVLTSLGAVLLLLASGAWASPSAPASATEAAHPLVYVVKNVTAGSSPRGIVFDPDNHLLYVANAGSNTTSAIHGTTTSPRTISVGKGPAALAYAPSGHAVVVANRISGTLSIVNATNKVIHTTALPGADPDLLIYDAANLDIYALSYGPTYDFLSDVDHTTWKVVKAIHLPTGGGEQVAFDNASSSLVVTSPSANRLTVVSPTNGVTMVNLTVGLTPSAMVYSPKSQDLYVADSGLGPNGITTTGNVTVLGPKNTVVATLPVAPNPKWVAYDPGNLEVFVVSLGIPTHGHYPNSRLTALLPNNSVRTVLTVGRFAGLPVFSPTNGELYVACAGSNRTYAIGAAKDKLVANLSTGGAPSVAIYDEGNGQVLTVGDSLFDGRAGTTPIVLTSISKTDSLSGRAILGLGPAGGWAYDPRDVALWVTSEGSGIASFVK